MVGICLYTPLCICMPPCTFIHPLYACTPPCLFIWPPRVYTSPRGPPCFCAPAWFWHIACCGGGLFFCFMCIGTHHPYLGVPPLYYTPTLRCWFSVHCYSQGYQFLCGPFSPSIEGFGGVPPITGGGWGDTSVAVHMLILLHLFL